LFEAAYSGLPVSVTGWSGHLDFLKASDEKGKTRDFYEKISHDLGFVQEEAKMENILTEQMKWAFPRKSSLEKAMKNMIAAKTAKKNIAKKLQKHLLSQFSKEQQYSKVVAECLSFYDKTKNWNNNKQQVVEI
jgi:hypothetical protein